MLISFRQFFGMPLHADNERQKWHFQRFGQAIIGAGHHAQPAAQVVNPLVMHRVNFMHSTQRPRQAAVCFYSHLMRNAITFKVGREVVMFFQIGPLAVQILVERTATDYVDHLETATDAEHGHARFERPARH